MEITLLYLTINNINIAECRAAQTECDAPFYLTFNPQRIHCKTAVQHANHTVNGEVTVIRNTDLHCLRNRRY